MMNIRKLNNNVFYLLWNEKSKSTARETTETQNNIVMNICVDKYLYFWSIYIAKEWLDYIIILFLTFLRSNQIVSQSAQFRVLF